MRSPEQGKHYELPEEKAERVTNEMINEIDEEERVFGELNRRLKEEDPSLRKEINEKDHSITVFDGEGHVVLYVANLSPEEMGALEKTNVGMQALQKILSKKKNKGENGPN